MAKYTMNFIINQDIILNNKMILLSCMFTFKAEKNLPLIAEGLLYYQFYIQLLIAFVIVSKIILAVIIITVKYYFLSVNESFLFSKSHLW